MKCRYCGKELPEESLFCIYCGKPTQQKPEEFAEPIDDEPVPVNELEEKEESDVPEHSEETDHGNTDNSTEPEKPENMEQKEADQPETAEESAEPDTSEKETADVIEEQPAETEQTGTAEEQPAEEKKEAETESSTHSADAEPKTEKKKKHKIHLSDEQKKKANVFTAWLKEEGKAMLSIFHHPLTSDAELSGLIIPASIFIHTLYLYRIGSGLFYEVVHAVAESVGALVMSMYGLTSFSRSDINHLLKNYDYSYWSCFGWGILLSAALLGICMLSAWFEEEKPSFHTVWQKAAKWMFIPEICLLAASFTAKFSFILTLLITLFALSFLLVYLITSLNSGRMNPYGKAVFIACTILMVIIIVVWGTWSSIARTLSSIARSTNIWG